MPSYSSIARDNAVSRNREDYFSCRHASVRPRRFLTLAMAATIVTAVVLLARTGVPGGSEILRRRLIQLPRNARQVLSTAKRAFRRTVSPRLPWSSRGLDEPNKCTDWKIVNSPREGDWAVVETAFRLSWAGPSIFNPTNQYTQNNYHDEYFRSNIRAMTSDGVVRGGKALTSEPSGPYCSPGTLEDDYARNIRWAEISGWMRDNADVKKADAGNLALGGDGGYYGADVTGLYKWGREVSWRLEGCDYGYFSVVSYPVRYGQATSDYSEMRGEFDLAKQQYKFSWKTDGDSPSWLDKCWGPRFGDSGEHGQTCVSQVKAYLSGSHLATVQMETVVKAWVRGPVQNGEITRLDLNTNLDWKDRAPRRFMDSFYGGMSEQCSGPCKWC